MQVSPQLSPAPGGILLVGEAPGDEEVIKGFPFVGPQGHLLNHGLRAARLTRPGDPPADYWPSQRAETRRMLWERRDHSFTYVVNDRQVPRLQRQPHKLVTEADLARLQGEIETCRPTLIVPLGGTALWALTGSAEIAAYRGGIAVTTRLVPSIKLLPTYDPGTVLSSYKLLVPLISDLTKVKREAQFPEVRLAAVETWLEPTLSDLAEFRDRYIRPEAGPLSVDIETGGGQISCLSLSPDDVHSLIVPFVDYRQPDRSYWGSEADEVRAWEFVAAVLADPTIEKLFQNGGAFDVFWFLDKMGLPVVNYRHDLRLVHKTLYPELGADLQFRGAR